MPRLRAERKHSEPLRRRLPYPIPTSPAATAKMRANPRRDTRPELRLRSRLHALGLRFRKDHRLDVGEVRVRPDVVFSRLRVAVFIDGCFWHCCPQHGGQPKSNRAYWLPKLRKNIERDREVDRALAAGGWRVVRIWEHVPTDHAAQIVQAALRDVAHSQVENREQSSLSKPRA
jgi:DNA mismatch endonuclease, patch repair protein